ncbi:MAG: winged helix-turn-helix transcriptional regulator [Candidatus Saganbacteria bacterium]|nr:winged helix-turn-helix transcriptional regulator [Candidatus Saganbacteria bacterium]
MSELQNTTDFDELDGIDRAIILESQANPAITQQELANQLGISRQVVNARFNSAKVQVALRGVFKDAVAILKDNQAEAAKVMAGLLGSDNENVRFRAAEFILKDLILPESEDDVFSCKKLAETWKKALGVSI